jgi:alpha-L-fucosidase
MFPDTWGYRSWEKRGDLPGKIRENIARLVRVVSAGGNYLLNIGPEGDGSVVPYEAAVLRGIGAWLKPRGEAVYGTRPAPFGKLDFGYATLGAHALYLFVEKPPADGVLRLPGVVDTRFGAGRVLADPRAGVAPVVVDAAGATVRVEGLAGAGYMPVVALPLAGALHVRPDATAPGADGRVRLSAAHAERFLDYNGYGYDDPPSLYKLRWYAAVGVGDYALAVHYRDARAPARLDVWVDGRRQPLALPAGAGTARLRVRRDARAQPYAMQVELTPVAPFHKGDSLPATIDAVELAPAGATPSKTRREASRRP